MLALVNHQIANSLLKNNGSNQSSKAGFYIDNDVSDFLTKIIAYETAVSNMVLGRTKSLSYSVEVLPSQSGIIGGFGGEKWEVSYYSSSFRGKFTIPTANASILPVGTDVLPSTDPRYIALRQSLLDLLLSDRLGGIADIEGIRYVNK